MTDFHDALLAHGLRPRYAPRPDGKVYRCSTESHPHRRNGAYMLSTSGDFGWYHDWSKDSEAVIWTKSGGSSDPAPIDLAKLREQQREDRHRRWRASREAREFFAGLPPLRGGHPYLESHGLDMTGCSGLRIAYGGWPTWRDGQQTSEDAPEGGWIIVPMYRGGVVVSLQRIAADGAKKFWPGPSAKAVHYAIDRRGAAVTVLAEGLATGLAIFAACKFARVIVAFTAGNLPALASALEWSGNVVVAADNDARTEERRGVNPGIEAAQEAASIIGCGVMVPPPEHGSDWCDWRQGEASRRREKRPYGSRQTDAQIRQTVDAEIAMEVQRRMAFVVGKRRAGCPEPDRLILKWH